jgi:hypothetical protein
LLKGRSCRPWKAWTPAITGHTTRHPR